MRIINILLKVVSLIIGITVGTKQVLIGSSTGEIFISFSLIVIVFIPNILRKKGLMITPTIEFIFLIFILFAQTLGSVLDFYQTFYFYDKVMHFLSGLLTSFIGVYILLKFQKYSKKSLIFNCIIIIVTVMAIASFWEMFEFTCDALFGGDAQNVSTSGVDDTMFDMILALIGSVLICITYLYEEINNKKILVRRFIAEIK